MKTWIVKTTDISTGRTRRKRVTTHADLIEAIKRAQANGKQVTFTKE